MIDYFAIALTHGLIVVAAWRLFQNDALDVDPADAAKQNAGKAESRDA
jgi:hypothetical protein